MMAFAAVLLLSQAALAQDVRLRELYTVRGVAVDETASTASEARAKAMASGQVAALNVLLRRLVPARDHAQLPEADTAMARRTVADLAIEQERSSAVRYLASLTVRFRPDAVRQILRDAQVAFTDTIRKPLLAVPVFQHSLEAAPLLWEDDNPWFATWAGRVDDDRLVPVIAPLGDLQDVSAVGADEALLGNLERLSVLAERYDTEHALVALAVVTDTFSPTLDVYMRVSRLPARGNPGSVGQTEVMTVKGDGSGNIDVALGRAAERIIDVLEQRWRDSTAVVFGAGAVRTILVPVTSLAHWQRMAQKLRRVSLIGRMELQAMKKDMAQVTLTYAGDDEQLALAMGQNDLVLDRSTTLWTLTEGTRTP